MVTPLLLWVLVAPYRPFAPLELSGIFLCYGNILALIIFYSGIVIFCVSLLQWFLYRHKKHRFFTKGLYAKVRHPQFLGIILVSLGLTITLGCHPMGWRLVGVIRYLPNSIGVNELIGLWFLQVLGYIAFALLEEWSLSNRFSEFKEYKEKVPLLMPVKNPKIIPEAVFTILLVLTVCVILFLLPYDLLFWLRLP
jgi:protein-S-isoprenylcysteine O-methyltransferase Ste14